MVVFTDGSVKRAVKSGWAHSERQNAVIVVEGSGVFAQTTSNMCMVVRTIQRVA